MKSVTTPYFIFQFFNKKIISSLELFYFIPSHGPSVSFAPVDRNAVQVSVFYEYLTNSLEGLKL